MQATTNSIATHAPPSTGQHLPSVKRRPSTAGADQRPRPVTALSPGPATDRGSYRAGHSNRDIAQALFVTIKTVEMYLTRIYRKLDMSSRRHLAGARRGGRSRYADGLTRPKD